MPPFVCCPLIFSACEVLLTKGHAHLAMPMLQSYPIISHFPMKINALASHSSQPGDSFSPLVLEGADAAGAGAAGGGGGLSAAQRPGRHGPRGRAGRPARGGGAIISCVGLAAVTFCFRGQRRGAWGGGGKQRGKSRPWRPGCVASASLGAGPWHRARAHWPLPSPRSRDGADSAAEGLVRVGPVTFRAKGFQNPKTCSHQDLGVCPHHVPGGALGHGERAS